MALAHVEKLQLWLSSRLTKVKDDKTGGKERLETFSTVNQHSGSPTRRFLYGNGSAVFSSFNSYIIGLTLHWKKRSMLFMDKILTVVSPVVF